MIAIILVNLILFATSVKPPLSTQGKWVIDSTGVPVRFACANWYGAHMERFVVNGADKQPLSTIANKIASLGFNCVRLPYSVEMFIDNRVPPDNALAKNPELKGKSASEVYDATVKAITDAGLMVIINSHVSKAMWCCGNDDGQGLWHTDQYSPEDFENVAVELSKRYVDNPMVVGNDLRNELRHSNIGDPKWGSGGEDFDWHMEAEKVGNMVLKVNPNMLIFVEGLSYANKFPWYSPKVQLDSPNKLIYSGHIYSWDPDLVHDLNGANTGIQDNLLWIADRDNVPFWIGEMGTSNYTEDYWKKIMGFLRANEHIGWSYWAIDGYTGKFPGDPESYGILNEQYSDVQQEDVLKTLEEIMKQPQTLCGVPGDIWAPSWIGQSTSHDVCGQWWGNKDWGANSDCANCAVGTFGDNQCSITCCENCAPKYEKNAGTGGWGGYCTCPNGQKYAVGDNHDGCGSLACIGGESGKCNQWEGEWSGSKVTCNAGEDTNMLLVEESLVAEVNETAFVCWLIYGLAIFGCFIVVQKGVSLFRKEQEYNNIDQEC